MPITTTQSVISTTSILSECLLLSAFAFRRHRRFWFVAGYGLYHLAFSAALRTLDLKRRDLSDFVYYADVGVDFALLSGVVAELFFATVGRARAGLSNIRRYLILGLTVGVSLASLLVVWLSYGALPHRDAWADRIDLLTSFLLCTFVLMVTWATHRLKAPRSPAVTTIGRGLTLWASIALVVDLSHMNAMWSQSPIFDEVSNAAWTFMIVLWSMAFFRSDYYNGRELLLRSTGPSERG